MANFLKISIYDSYMSHTYVIFIFSESEFCGEFYEDVSAHEFFESAHAKLWKWIFSEMRRRNFFSFSNSKTTQKSTSNDIHWHRVYPTHAYAEGISNFWGLLTPTHYENTFEGLEIITIVFGRFDYPKKVRNWSYLVIFYTEKQSFSLKIWKCLLVFS